MTKSKVFKSLGLLAVMLLAAGCGNTSSSAVAASSAAASSQATVSSAVDSSAAAASSASASNPVSSSSSAPVNLPDQKYRTVANEMFTKGQISVNINKMLGVDVPAATKGRKPLNRLFNDSVHYGPEFADTVSSSAASSSASNNYKGTLYSDKDYVFTPESADPYYYSGIKPDGSWAKSSASSPITVIQDYGDGISTLVKGFIATNPYIDVKVKYGNNTFMMHYDEGSKTAYLIIDDNDYFLYGSNKIKSETYWFKLTGRKILVRLAFDATGKETLDAQASSPISYSDNYHTLFPHNTMNETANCAIHFVEGQSYDYYFQEENDYTAVYSIKYDQNDKARALFMGYERQNPTDSTGALLSKDLPDTTDYAISANYLDPLAEGGYLEQQVNSYWASSGVPKDVFGQAFVFDKDLKEIFKTDEIRVGSQFQNTLYRLYTNWYDLSGWTKAEIKNGKTYTEKDSDGVLRSYHYADNVTFTSPTGATHVYKLDAGYDAYGIDHQDGINPLYGYTSAFDTTNAQPIEFSAIEYSEIAIDMKQATAALTGSNYIEKLSYALSQYGFSLNADVSAENTTAYVAGINKILEGFSENLSGITWDNNKDVLRTGCKDYIQAVKERLLVIDTDQILPTIEKGFMSASEITEKDSDKYQVAFTVPVFAKDSTAEDLLATVAVSKTDIAAPDPVISVSNLGYLDGTNLVECKPGDKLVDNATYNFHLTVNNVTILSKSMQIRVAVDEVYQISLERDSFVKGATINNLIGAAKITTIGANPQGLAATYQNFYTVEASPTVKGLSTLAQVASGTTQLVDGKTYVCLVTDANNGITGFGLFKVAVDEVPYSLTLGDTTGLTATSTVADLLKCVTVNKLTQEAADYTLTNFNVMMVLPTGEMSYAQSDTASLVSGVTYTIVIGAYGVIYDQVSAAFLFA
jgi:hypothetical protein